jgi:hypothetical protein
VERLRLLGDKPVGFLQLVLGGFVLFQFGEALAELLVPLLIVVKPG